MPEDAKPTAHWVASGVALAVCLSLTVPERAQADAGVAADAKTRGVQEPTISVPSGGDATVPGVAARPTEDGGPAPALSGFLDINGYYDTRNSTGLTINLLANLPLRFQYFSFMNFFNPADAQRIGDQEGFFSEQNLRWAPHDAVPVDATVQGVFRSGGENDLLRLGMRWRLSNTPWIRQLFELIHLTYSVNFHVYEFDFQATDGYALQLEHVYKLQVLPEHLGNRIYIAGFMDHNLRLGGSAGVPRSRIVTEHQLGVRLVAGLHAVAELRYNQFFEAKRMGVGLGFQYLVSFRHEP